MTGALGGPRGRRNGDRLVIGGLHLTQPGGPVTATLGAPQLLAPMPRQSTPAPRSHG
ncbi:hypothetical protein AB0C70_09835 [Streptomyces sp. NPDC048564]|uniref:hypothetical protein n=1 Tax=Streptomyces sp. NPDC048564 TaxID=3155760 RepID=UPI00343AC9FE